MEKNVEVAQRILKAVNFISYSFTEYETEIIVGIVGYTANELDKTLIPPKDLIISFTINGIPLSMQVGYDLLFGIVKLFRANTIRENPDGIVITDLQLK